MQGIVTAHEQLDLFGLPVAAPKKRTSIVIRRSETADIENVAAFLNRPAPQNSIVAVDETGGAKELIGVIGWQVGEGYVTLEAPVTADLEYWHREQLISLSLALISDVTDTTYTYAAEDDVKYLEHRGFKEVVDAPEVVSLKGRLMVRNYNEDEAKVKAFLQTFMPALKMSQAVAKTEMARGGE